MTTEETNTDQIEETTVGNPTVDESEAVEETEFTEQDDQQDDKNNPSREAAKYRKQLREAEAERDTLQGQLETLQRAEVERHAQHLTQPSAIWKAGVELTDMQDDDGNLDPEKITSSITTAADTLGLAERRRPPKPNPAQMEDGAMPGARGDNMASVIAGIAKH